MSAHRIALPLVWALIFPGCSHMAKARECRDLARRVNGALDEVKLLEHAHQEQPAALRKTADRYTRLAADITRARPVHHEKLAKSVGELASVFKKSAAILRQLADANQAKQTAKAALARRQLGDMARRERADAEHVNSLCGAQ